MTDQKQLDQALKVLETEHAALTGKLNVARAAAAGPVPSGSTWDADCYGITLTLMCGPEIGWSTEGHLETGDSIECDHDLTLEALEEFCKRSRDWRDARGLCS